MFVNLPIFITALKLTFYNIYEIISLILSCKCGFELLGVNFCAMEEEKFSKQYNPNLVEDKIYSFWQQNNCFNQSQGKDRYTFSIIMPPPNVTGKLHMGHALDNTLQDILVRYKRMSGFNVLWVPGLDHSAISTEVKVCGMLKKRGISKSDLTREEFLKYAYDWKEKYGSIIINQVKKLGVSCNWEKLKFTMDDSCSSAVQKVFVTLYNEGYIYRGKRIVNYCPGCKTSLSDIEVTFKEQPGILWHLKYYLKDSQDEYLTVATTRPETLLGDVALAVHPDDNRYKDYIGKMVKVPLIDRLIPIIADNFVDMKYGTGVVKITPAHDINDFEVGLRHNLDSIAVISKEGLMLETAGKYKGLKVEDARGEILKDLVNGFYIEKSENMSHNVGRCYRCDTLVEPLVSEQWFVKTERLASDAIDCVRNNGLRFLPKRFTKIYLNWLLNIKDWCISRQIWWGHRIPVYYCKDCGEAIVSEQTINCCSKCNSGNVVQDEDTLDTWFSSGLWPFSVFNWPYESEDFVRFYPTSVLVTGYDIIFFWVARMVMLSLKFTKKVPFKDVLIHGLVRDKLGRKMSKSLGNGIDPIDIINDFGADALRFMLIKGNTLGNDIRFSEEKLTASRNFINKLYNAARYIFLKADNISFEFKNFEPALKDLKPEDKWILSKLRSVVTEINLNLEKYEFGIALGKLYDFIWNVFCDWYIEFSKIRLNDASLSEESKVLTKQILVYILIIVLKLLHPFIPFVTEELWQVFTNGKFGPLMLNEFPRKIKIIDFIKETKLFDSIIEIIKAIRKRRTELNVPAGKILSSIFIDYYDFKLTRDDLVFIKKLARVSNIETACDVSSEKSKEMNVIVTSSAKIYINNDELFDKNEELVKLQTEIKKAEDNILKLEAQLNNENFLEKAPAEIVEKIRNNKLVLESKIKNLKETKERLGN